MSEAWPIARLDRIARLRVMAAGLPGTTVVETRIDRPFDEVWAWVSDLEVSVPTFDGDVKSLRIERGGDPDVVFQDLRIRTSSTAAVLWIPLVHDVKLARGWCWMASRPQIYVVGMAAEPDGDDATRFALLEGLGFAFPRPLRLLLWPILAASRWRHRRHIPHDLAGIRRALES